MNHRVMEPNRTVTPGSDGVDTAKDAGGLASLPGPGAGVGIKLPVSLANLVPCGGPCGEFGVDGGQMRQDRHTGR